MTMEKRGVSVCMLMLMLFLLSSMAPSVSAASTTTRKLVPQNTEYEYYSERLRRNLLANGLGSTPPMGYYAFLFLFSLFVLLSFLHIIAEYAGYYSFQEPLNWSILNPILIIRSGLSVTDFTDEIKLRGKFTFNEFSILNLKYY